MHNKKQLYIFLIIFLTMNTATISDDTLPHTPNTSVAPTETIVEQSKKNFDEIIFDSSRTLAQVIDIANKKHYNITDPEESMIKAIDGFVSNLDAHSCLLDGKTYENMLKTMSGEFYGIGIMIDNMRKPKDKFLTIVDTIPYGPSDKAGLLPMDKILEVDGQTLEGMPTEKIIAKIKGEKGTKVILKVARENHPELLTLEVIRDVIKEQHSLSFLIKNYNIAYISLSIFTDTGTKQLSELLQKAQKNNLKGLILDLRNNSGGLLSAAINIGSFFLKKGSLIVTTKKKNNEHSEQYATTREPIANNSIPIFILINNYTASASEILAGCLKYYSEQPNNPLVFLIGTTTFGKGSVQEVIPLNDCALKLTTALYYLPDDTTLQGVGIQPDFFVERTMPMSEQSQWFIKHYGREETLARSIKPNGTVEKKEESSIETTKADISVQDAASRRLQRAQEMLQTDNQLHDCITLINIFNSAQKYTPDLITTRSSTIAYLKDNFLCKDKLEIEEVTI